MSGLLFIWIVKTILASNACGSPQAICASSVFVATNAFCSLGDIPNPPECCAATPAGLKKTPSKRHQNGRRKGEELPPMREKHRAFTVTFSARMVNHYGDKTASKKIDIGSLILSAFLRPLCLLRGSRRCRVGVCPPCARGAARGLFVAYCGLVFILKRIIHSSSQPRCDSTPLVEQGRASASGALEDRHHGLGWVVSLRCGEDLRQEIFVDLKRHSPFRFGGGAFPL